MLTEERHSYILNELRKKEVIQVQELVQDLGVSESTIRRDLQELDDLGKLERVHGGARSLYRIEQEKSLKEKSIKNIHEKNIIAKEAASLVQNHETIFVEAGTTTLAMIPYLAGKDIIVVTNSIHLAVALTDLEIQIFLIGGKVKNTTKAIIGSTATQQLSTYQFSRSFLGTNGVHLQYGFTTPDEREASMKSMAIKQSKRAYILADHTKFGVVNFIKFGELNEATVITDSIGSEEKTVYGNYTHILEANS